jgi:hypothetical protein
MEYRGDAVESFVLGLKVYTEMYSPKLHYGRSIAIPQSSATGKSRLVQELGKKVCVRRAAIVLVNQRASDTNPQYLFPKKRRAKRRLATCGPTSI